MQKTKLVAVIATAVTLFAAPAFAADNPAADAAYAEIEKTFGTVPTHIKGYPKSAVSGAWEMTKGLLFGEGNELEPKVKSLIGLAVAAQIPCEYCIWADTMAAKAAGATDEEIGEAVALAGHTRNWSTMFNGLQVDFDQFKKDLGGEMAAK